MTSDSDSSQEFEEIGESRRVYLLTYSQADLEKFPNCQSFSNIIIDSFNQVKSSRTIKEWACCQEQHGNGGFHYHMAVSLNGTRRWRPVKNFIYEKYGISVNFATKNCGYVAAYRYVCKDKPITSILHSPDHSNLQQLGTPKTNKAMIKYSEDRRAKRKSLNLQHNQKSECKKTGKIKRLTNVDVSNLLVKENIRTEIELMRLALTRKESGEPDLQQFILNKTPKALSDLVATTWKMQKSPACIERRNKPRIQVVQEHISEECIPDCGGKWYRSAVEVLSNNQINLYYFCGAMREALVKGRRKNTNILIVGPTNCGKSFLLNPLEDMFKAFVNPATGKYAWIGLDECEVAYLNDFRWSPETIAWGDFLLLLEGQTVHLPRPKNQFSTDMCIDRSNTIPFFATSKTDIEYIGKYNNRDQRETDMMSSRWMTFRFNRQIENPQFIEPCKHCFAKFIMAGDTKYSE